MSQVSENLSEVRDEISQAAKSAGRAETDVTLVAVSKFHSQDRTRLVLEAGQRVFGENRVQEAEQKWPELRKEYPDARIHLIGPLQTNKVKHAVATFDVIETLDREKLARALAKEFAQSGKALECYIQVNTGAEPQKAGVMPQEVDAFVELCRGELGLNIKGLMCIPPVDDEPALHFGLLNMLAKRNDLQGLSMGMSSDYVTAIRCGATLVRVGTLIFGERPKLED